MLFSENFACQNFGVSLPELEPRIFSFNSPHGACSRCTGLGAQLEIDPDLLVPDTSLSIAGRRARALVGGGLGLLRERDPGDLRPLRDRSRHALARAACGTTRPLLYGTKGERIFVSYRNRMGRKRQYTMAFEGIVKSLERRYRKDGLDAAARADRGVHERLPAVRRRPAQARVLAVTVGGQSIHGFTLQSVTAALRFLDELELTPTEQLIGHRIVKEIRERLTFLDNVGVGYLQLDRAAKTLSGGEAQRLRLATQIGSQLVGVLYILDEPSIGLRQRDNGKLIATLERLRDLGNTVLVVEHDEQMMRTANWLVDMGPPRRASTAARWWPRSADAIERATEIVAGQFLSGERRIAVPPRRTRRSRRLHRPPAPRSTT